MPTLLKRIAEDLSDIAFAKKIRQAIESGMSSGDLPIYLDIGGPQRFEQWAAGEHLPASPKKRSEILKWIENKLARLNLPH